MSTTTALRPEDNAWDSNDRSLKRGHEEVVTPTTPRPPSSQTFQSLSAEVGTDPVADASGPSSLPTDQVSLPPTTFGFPAQHDSQRGMLYRGSSQSSLQSSMAVDDMEIDGSDDDQDGSDNDTENGEPGRSSKKKKGQRFFCTEFPPCNLSFTRSEHLARHIRYSCIPILDPSLFCLLSSAGNTQENGHSNAIATGGSLVLITFDNMHKRYMSTKKSQATHLLQQELGSNDRSVLTECGQPEVDLAVAPLVAPVVFRGVIAEICRHPVLVQTHLPIVMQQNHIGGLHLSSWPTMETADPNWDQNLQLHRLSSTVATRQTPLEGSVPLLQRPIQPLQAALDMDLQWNLHYQPALEA